MPKEVIINNYCINRYNVKGCEVYDGYTCSKGRPEEPPGKIPLYEGKSDQSQGNTGMSLASGGEVLDCG
jgi:hypothetical protein